MQLEDVLRMLAQQQQQQQSAVSVSSTGVVGANLPPELVNSSHFRMYCFKILPCPRKHGHDWTACPFAHVGEKAGRRCPQKHSYMPIACPDIKKTGECPRGQACNYAHNVFEFWCHPLRFRTQLCSFGSDCKRSICFFAHSFQELRVVDASALQELERQLELMGEGTGFGFPPAGRRTRDEIRHMSVRDMERELHAHVMPHVVPLSRETVTTPSTVSAQDTGGPNQPQLGLRPGRTSLQGNGPVRPGSTGSPLSPADPAPVTPSVTTPAPTPSGVGPNMAPPMAQDTSAATAAFAQAVAQAAAAVASAAASGISPANQGHVSSRTTGDITLAPAPPSSDVGGGGASSTTALLLQLQAELLRQQQNAQAPPVTERVSADRVYAAAVLLGMDAGYLNQLLAQNSSAPAMVPPPSGAALQNALLQAALIQSLGSANSNAQAQQQAQAAALLMQQQQQQQQQQVNTQQLMPSLAALLAMAQGNSGSGGAAEAVAVAAAAASLGLQGMNLGSGQPNTPRGNPGVGISPRGSLMSPMASLVSPLPSNMGPLPSLTANEDQMAATLKLLADMSAAGASRRNTGNSLPQMNHNQGGGGGGGNHMSGLLQSSASVQLQALNSLTNPAALQATLQASMHGGMQDGNGHRSTNSEASVDSLFHMMTELTGRMSGAWDSSEIHGALSEVNSLKLNRQAVNSLVFNTAPGAMEEPVSCHASDSRSDSVHSTHG